MQFLELHSSMFDRYLEFLSNSIKHTSFRLEEFLNQKLQSLKVQNVEYLESINLMNNFRPKKMKDLSQIASSPKLGSVSLPISLKASLHTCQTEPKKDLIEDNKKFSVPDKSTLSLKQTSHSLNINTPQSVCQEPELKSKILKNWGTKSISEHTSISMKPTLNKVKLKSNFSPKCTISIMSPSSNFSSSTLCKTVQNLKLKGKHVKLSSSVTAKSTDESNYKKKKNISLDFSKLEKHTIESSSSNLLLTPLLPLPVQGIDVSKLIVNTKVFSTKNSNEVKDYFSLKYLKSQLSDQRAIYASLIQNK